ncbi:MAG: ABC transporter permease [Patescibacteria group bacterium]
MIRTIIKPKEGWVNINIKELWNYKDLLYFFTWRDIKVRYKQTALGVIWAILQPLVAMIIFTVFFGRLAKMPSDGIPYPIFVYVGLLLWNFFSMALANASQSLVSHENMIKKIYFPRLFLPTSSILAAFVDFILATFILIGLMIYYQYTPYLVGILIIPLLIIITFLSAAGTSFFLAAINVKYRDIRYAVPFFIQIMMFLTPVIYPSSLVGKYQWIMNLNPMSGVIEAARAAILGQGVINWQSLAISGGISLILFVFGLFYFTRTEKYFADLI